MRSTSIGLLTAVTLAATACHTMTPLTLKEINTLRPPHAWVTDSDESVFQIAGPQVYGDTIVGYVNGQFRELPNSTVKQVTVRRLARAKTIALIAAGTAAATGIAVWMAGSGIFGRDQYVDCMDVPDDPACQFGLVVGYR